MPSSTRSTTQRRGLQISVQIAATSGHPHADFYPFSCRFSTTNVVDSHRRRVFLHRPCASLRSNWRCLVSQHASVLEEIHCLRTICSLSLSVGYWTICSLSLSVGLWTVCSLSVSVGRWTVCSLTVSVGRWTVCSLSVSVSRRTICPLSVSVGLWTVCSLSMSVGRRTIFVPCPCQSVILRSVPCPSLSSCDLFGVYLCRRAICSVYVSVVVRFVLCPSLSSCDLVGVHLCHRALFSVYISVVVRIGRCSSLSSCDLVGVHLCRRTICSLSVSVGDRTFCSVSSSVFVPFVPCPSQLCDWFRVHLILYELLRVRLIRRTICPESSFVDITFVFGRLSCRRVCSLVLVNHSFFGHMTCRTNILWSTQSLYDLLLVHLSRRMFFSFFFGHLSRCMSCSLSISSRRTICLLSISVVV